MASPARLMFPNMQITMVRRHSMRLPRNTFVFRCSPKYGKTEIKEYLQKVYGVTVLRVATINYLGKIRRFGARRIYKLKDFKKVYVTISNEPFTDAATADTYRPKLSEAGEAVMAEVETTRREAAAYEAQHGDGRV